MSHKQAGDSVAAQVRRHRASPSMHGRKELRLWDHPIMAIDFLVICLRGKRGTKLQHRHCREQVEWWDHPLAIDLLVCGDAP
eukprot:scaffold41047_cov67-Cyclotella_meneghiniana.AAC.2